MLTLRQEREAYIRRDIKLFEHWQSSVNYEANLQRRLENGMIERALNPMKIQNILGAFLSSQGEHDAAAMAYESTDRSIWLALAELAIRTAPEWNRTHVAHVVTLALDAPCNGGPGFAEGFMIRAHEHPFLHDTVLYRAYRLTPDTVEAGFVSQDRDLLIRRLVGAYVVKYIIDDDGKRIQL